MEPIRVLQVLTIMNRGGAETMIMNYYRHIDRNKVQFDFLLHRDEKGAFDDEIRQLGGQIYYMPPIAPQNYFKYKDKLKQFFDEHKEYQIVHSHLNALSSIVLGVAKLKGISVRIAHSHIAIEPRVFMKIFKRNTDIKATLKDTLQALIKYKVKKNATHYFACGLKAGEWLFGSENKDQITIINNAIDASLFSFNEVTSKKIKASLGLTGKKVIGHIGRFNEQKNHFFLIKVFEKLVKENNNLHLVLIGCGNLMDNIKVEAKKLGLIEKISFLGVRSDIPDLLQAFDLFLFPSLYEGLPVTLIEAQASGLKIITSTTVSPEVAITPLVSFCSLKENEDFWVKKVIHNLEYTRVDTYNDLVVGNYDIKENANKLQQFYLKKSTNVWN